MIIFDFKNRQDFVLSLASVRAFIMVRKSGKLLLVLALLLGKRGVKPERRKVVQIPTMFWVQLVRFPMLTHGSIIDIVHRYRRKKKP